MAIDAAPFQRGGDRREKPGMKRLFDTDTHSRASRPLGCYACNEDSHADVCLRLPLPGRRRHRRGGCRAGTRAKAEVWPWMQAMNCAARRP